MHIPLVGIKLNAGRGARRLGEVSVRFTLKSCVHYCEFVKRNDRQTAGIMTLISPQDSKQHMWIAPYNPFDADRNRTTFPRLLRNNQSGISCRYEMRDML